MTGKERVIAAIERTGPDRAPMFDAFWEDTLTRWYDEGLPVNAAPHEFFGFDITDMGIDSSPRFTPELINEDGEYYTFRDRFGYVAKKYRGKSRTLDFLSHPVSSRDDWHRVRDMFVLARDNRARIDIEKFPFRLTPEPTWDEARNRYHILRDTGRFILASAYGPHEAVWRMHGYTETLMDLALDPSLITEMAETYVDFLIKVLGQCLAEGIQFDGFFAIDDVAATRGMLFSPDMWRTIYKPLYRKLGAFLREKSLYFFLHCCGNAEAIFPDLIECGLDVIQPLEAKSGLDVNELKLRYGDRLTFFGNIDVRTIAASKDAISTEIHSKLTAFPRGGYIYHSDHSIPPEVSLDNYRYALEAVRSIPQD